MHTQNRKMIQLYLKKHVFDHNILTYRPENTVQIEISLLPKNIVE